MTTVFSKILRGEIPTKPVYEDDLVYAFDDISPVAPVHVLVIPRQEIVNLNNVDTSHEAMLGRLLHAARKVAEAKGVADSGYRCVINNGGDAGQSVFHLHLHVIGGRGLAWPPG
jgi:histidine triad (HIT) family protein